MWRHILDPLVSGLIAAGRRAVFRRSRFQSKQTPSVVTDRVFQPTRSLAGGLKSSRHGKEIQSGSLRAIPCVAATVGVPILEELRATRSTPVDT
jgi:hypothetical protein